MWIPRWIRQLRQDASSTQKALQQQERSIADATQAWEEKQTEIGSTIAAAINTAADTIANSQNSQGDKESSVQWGLFWVTLAGALFAAAAASGAWYYAHIAAGQLKTMNDTYTQIQKQTKAAEWSAYAACVNAQSVQEGLADTHAIAETSVEQSTLAIETERAIMSVTARVPRDDEIRTSTYLLIPYSISNAGKSAASKVVMRFRFLVVDDSETLRISEAPTKNDVVVTIPRFDGGYEYPGIPQPPLKQATLTVEAEDMADQTIISSSVRARALVDKGTATLFTVGHMKYDDFAGTHSSRFCYSAWVLPQEHLRNAASSNETRCSEYNETHDEYNLRPKIHPLPPATPMPCDKPPQ
jgi:hypothetical protein